MQTGEAVLALGAVAGLLAIGYYYIVTKSPFAKKAPKNSAFVFIKPHANTGEVQALAQKTFAEKGIKVLSSGELTAKEIDEKKLIDQHYYAIASKATILKPAELNVPKEKFKGKFGLEWQAALDSGKVFNAMDACKKLSIDANALDALWAKAKKADQLVKFGGGFYCGLVEGLYVFNGFFMSMRAKFVTPGTSIFYYVVEWDADATSWEQFRGEVLGPTDPKDAPPTSLRGLIYKQWKGLGLKELPNVGDNGVHASASPFEAMAERMNWLGSPLSSDPFGAALLDAGVREAYITEGTLDPQVAMPDGSKGSLFDALEDMDSADCLAKVVTLAAL